MESKEPMTQSPPAALEDRLARFGQEHLLRWWAELGEAQRHELARQIDTVDFEQIARLHHGGTGQAEESPAERARRAESPRQVVRRPQSDADRAAWAEADHRGRELLAGGRVGALLVAGGQGTRLGFPHPKGMYPVGPVSGHSLFQILAEQVLARTRQAGRPIPYFIMTSDATHAETVAWFHEQQHFGLNPDDVYFFPQGNMPAVDAATGRLLLADKGQLCNSPDGHGGVLAALRRAGLLDEMRRRGIEYLHYHQVDNPTVLVCEPALLGFHLLHRSELTTKVVAKRAPEERMGVLVEVDGRTQIIEYSDLPADAARQTDGDGRLTFWAGNTAIHVFSRGLLERLEDDADSLPFHVAHKAVPFLNDAGELISPERPNAHKFERFIFDALPRAERTLIVEGDRAREFNPVKNADGDDSPATARAAMLRLHAGWLRTAGQPVPDGAAVEIGPLFALDEDELVTRLRSGPLYQGRVFLS